MAEDVCGTGSETESRPVVNSKNSSSSHSLPKGEGGEGEQAVASPAETGGLLFYPGRQAG